MKANMRGGRSIGGSRLGVGGVPPRSAARRIEPSATSSFAVVSVILLLTVALPVDAGAEEAKAQRYRAEFYSRIPGISPSAAATFYTVDSSYEVTVRDLADIYAEQMMALGGSPDNARGPSAPGEGRNGGGSQESGSEPAVLAAGEFSLFEQLYIDGSNPSVACSDLQQNRHYTVAVQVGPDDYVGAAFSDVSTYPLGVGQVVWPTGGQERFYHLEVYYAGYSTFACAEIRSGGDILLVNMPAVFGGFVIGATD